MPNQDPVEKSSTKKWEDEQLKDMTIVIAFSVLDDEGNPYTTSKIFHYDLQGDAEEFIKAMEGLTEKGSKIPFIVDGRQITK